MDEPNLFEKFGGTRKMAAALEEKPSTVNSWKAVGRIPAHRQPTVLERARELGLEVSAEDIVFPLGIGNVGSTADRSASESGNADEISACASHPFRASPLAEVRP